MKDQTTNNYSNQFVDVLNYCKKNNLYLGEGNSNAKILLIGKEAGMNNAESKELNNSSDKFKYIENLSNETVINNLFSLSNDYGNLGLPKLKADIAYNPTWSNYQRLINLIKGIDEQEIKRGSKNNWDFLNDCFITEISQIRLPKSNYLVENGFSNSIKEESIKNRAKLFQEPFFRKFPIVIIACGKDYIDNHNFEYDFNIERDFDVCFTGKTIEVLKEGDKKRWYNIHYQKKGIPRLVIHTRQFSTQRESTTSIYPLIDEIASICKDFIVTNNISI